MKSLPAPHIAATAGVILGLFLLVGFALTFHKTRTVADSHALLARIAELRRDCRVMEDAFIANLIDKRRAQADTTVARSSPAAEQELVRMADTLLAKVERALSAGDIHEPLWLALRDSLFTHAAHAPDPGRLTTGARSGVTVSNPDREQRLWNGFRVFQSTMTQVLADAENNAQQTAAAAVREVRSWQLLLLLVGIPGLLLATWFYGKGSSANGERKSNSVLREENLLLEQKVAERTRELVNRHDEITARNEELKAQQEVLSEQNTRLQEAQHTIQEQARQIQSLYDSLKVEVDNRTLELRETNQELIQHNNQLEQFAFIAAHNLRAPVTRVLGLANVIQMSASEQERQEALTKLVASTHDMDQVVKDLNAILNIRRHTANLSEVDLRESLERTKRILEKEIADTGTKIIHNFTEATRVYAIGAYVESILYNLISNAIKYRDPRRPPLVAIKTTQRDAFVCLAVMDNGLGIDLEKYRSSMFSLYKRFHLHVEGRGLGLYLVKTQIEALGGWIEVESLPNEGTTFNVYFKRYLI